MKTPESLESLVDYGILDEVIRPLMSGKEAQVYVVVAGGQECVAKVYKEANQRTFKHRVQYTEGRRTRNSRDQRAMTKRTRHGRRQDEAAWRSAEVDAIYRLRGEGVAVPEPMNFVDGVLVMEMVRDAQGDPAPRLGDLELSPEEALEIHGKLIREVVRMLCAGVIHGDLSEFNVLMAAEGPVVIDFPQAVDAAKNQSARTLLLRDVTNLHRFLARFAPDRTLEAYGEEIWSLYEKNRLTPDSELTGRYVGPAGDTPMGEVLALIEDANRDEQMRREARGDETPVEPATPMRRVVDFTNETRRPPRAGRSQNAGGAPRADAPEARPSTSTSAERPADREAPPAPPPKRRSRRRRPSRATRVEPTVERSRSSGPAKTADPRRDAERTERPSREPGGSDPGAPERSPRRRRGPRTRRSRPDEGEGKNRPQGSGQNESSTSPTPSANPARRRRRRSRPPGSSSS